MILYCTSKVVLHDRVVVHTVAVALLAVAAKLPPGSRVSDNVTTLPAIVQPDLNCHTYRLGQ